MQFFCDWTNLPVVARSASVALGNFDGVHLGHAGVIQAARAAQPDRPVAVLTFEPHPREFFRPQDGLVRLTSSSERRSHLEALGVNIVYELPFDTSFAHLTAEQFVGDVLHRGVGAAHLTCGQDFAFGHRRTGDVAFLTSQARAFGIDVTVASPVIDASGIISSTRIRQLLRNGQPERAAALLGRPFSVTGKITRYAEHGLLDGRSGAIVQSLKHFELAEGVYVITVNIPSVGKHLGLAYIRDSARDQFSVIIFDCNENLLSTNVTVELWEFRWSKKIFLQSERVKDFVISDALKDKTFSDTFACQI